MNKLLHFTAEWCKPCQRMKPTIEDFVINNQSVEYIRIDIETDFDIAKQYNVMGVPTLIAIKNGEVYNRHTGIADYQKIQDLFI